MFTQITNDPSSTPFNKFRNHLPCRNIFPTHIPNCGEPGNGHIDRSIKTGKQACNCQRYVSCSRHYTIL